MREGFGREFARIRAREASEGTMRDHRGRGFVDPRSVRAATRSSPIVNEDISWNVGCVPGNVARGVTPHAQQADPDVTLTVTCRRNGAFFKLASSRSWAERPSRQREGDTLLPRYPACSESRTSTRVAAVMWRSRQQDVGARALSIPGRVRDGCTLEVRGADDGWAFDGELLQRAEASARDEARAVYTLADQRASSHPQGRQPRLKLVGLKAPPESQARPVNTRSGSPASTLARTSRRRTDLARARRRARELLARARRLADSPALVRGARHRGGGGAGGAGRLSRCALERTGRHGRVRHRLQLPALAQLPGRRIAGAAAGPAPFRPWATCSCSPSCCGRRAAPSARSSATTCSTSPSSASWPARARPSWQRSPP